jgi:hypothetical protein
MARFKAYQLQNAAKLQLLNPTTTICQFFADMIIFHMTYNKVQYLGFAALIFLNLV